MCVDIHFFGLKLYVPGVDVMLFTLMAWRITPVAADSKTYSTLPSRLGTGDVAVPAAIAMPNLTVGVAPVELPVQPA